MTPERERHFLQAAICLGSLVPLATGLGGMLLGGALLHESTGVSFDSHFRYLSGLLFGIGVGFLWLVPRIESETARVRLLCLPIVLGGIARLAAALFVGMPSLPMLLAIGMELVVVPLLCLWQARVARRCAE